MQAKRIVLTDQLDISPITIIQDLQTNIKRIALHQIITPLQALIIIQGEEAVDSIAAVLLQAEEELVVAVVDNNKKFRTILFTFNCN